MLRVYLHTVVASTHLVCISKDCAFPVSLEYTLSTLPILVD